MKQNESILVNIFIWRDDGIGNRIAHAILDAANRGVKVKLSIDRYGVVLEKSEESKKSFFHKKTNLIEKIKILILKVFINAIIETYKRGVEIKILTSQKANY